MSKLSGVQDQMGCYVDIPYLPKRIVSLVPSQTELLFDLGLSGEIVGVTKFCIYPEELVRSKVNVGGTKKFRFEVIDELRPDLILGNKEENYKEGIEELKSRYPVWMSDIENLNDAYDMMLSIGKITGKFRKAQDIVNETKSQFKTLTTPENKKSVLYLIWQQPNMVAAQGTFIDHLLGKAGFYNLASHMSRYPELSDGQIREMNPDLIFLSSEPFPFKEKHQIEFQQSFPNSRVALVDGELFSWYGSRLKQAPEYFQKLHFL